MTIGLILDTSQSEALIAVIKQEFFLTKETLPQGGGLSKNFLPAIERLVSLDTLDYIAVCTGPGSFTGTRVAVTVGKTLAFALDLPLIGYSADIPTDVLLEHLYERFRQSDFAPEGILELHYTNVLKNKVYLS